ncbi:MULTISPECIES: NAD(P)/FAD-dependent oxidoreductase [Pseudonocardia]|uniref:Benzene 1,2-dioxygenase system ferredoxin--NAD(+) reductase subunit n=2 Tax=Pseudonocardia TaxID=1847 RepID=A0A1Y2MWF7_PSEAH|nr:MULTISPECIES: FAD-dependent oxidoreductase [Pseudonocardia]OSY38968.1 Benzene 1,2-dioxygenase system ferredoxin--NAD(+) reductase subunit [Pseudonocardia autotrophica]TDN76224.1 NAD/ferredoxin-dependent reductase-like protein [Pseudonocardia autotrophica]BBG00206.1 pyridine nucleotide-disulfide oxidoreductase [Pseudonocardia autotrophica]GEC26725.1 pyridine nucleotide-disulfide oxidoreductase [Pseudonocardia saturnea]
MRDVTVVGASLAGLATVRALREQGFDGRIVVVGDEKHAPYDRPPLSKDFLAGTASDTDVVLAGPDDGEQAAQWRLGRTAVALDGPGRVVTLDDGERLSSDAVVLATGARARTLPGEQPQGVHTLRTLDDARALRADLVPGRRLVVVGAGFVGAEVASTAAGLGLEVDIVEAAPVPLQRALGPEMGVACGRLHAAHGVRLHPGTGVAGIVGSPRVTGVRTDDGREFPADVVVVGIGALPNVEWLAGSGLELDDGVVTDACGRTALPGIVAVGDCAASLRDYTGNRLRLEHWTNALQQPAVAAAALLGTAHALPAHHAVPYFWSDQYGHRIQFAGHRAADGALRVEEGDPEDPAAGLLVLFLDPGGEPVGVLGIDRARPFGRWRRELAKRL